MKNVTPKPEKICAYCGDTLRSEDQFCDKACADSWYDLEMEWTVDVGDGTSLCMPKRRMYVATVSVRFGIVQAFYDYTNAEMFVYNGFHGNVSPGDMKRSIRVNLAKG